MMYSPFFIIGAQRSGTTKLFQLLDAHPEIVMARPVKPEPKFFLNPLDSIEKTREVYFFRHFPDLKEDQVPGEKSTTYIEVPEAGRRIKSVFPEAKILVMLRDPVQRALSNYFFSVSNKIEDRTLREVFLEKKRPPEFKGGISTNPYQYLERGDYKNYLKAYYSIFPKEQIQVLIFEEFYTDEKPLQEVFRFLEVDDSFVPSLSIGKKVNASSKEDIDPEVIEGIGEYYHRKIEALEDFLGRDLSCWRSQKMQ